MPESIDWNRPTILTTGGEEEVEIIRLRDEFFEHVSRRLGFAALTVSNNPFMEITLSDLGNETPGGFTYSDDRIHRMIVCNELMAIVFDRRNDGNYHEVTFWSRSPSETCEAQIASILSQSS